MTEAAAKAHDITLAAAIVLSRMAGTDRAVAFDGGSSWTQAISLPRRQSVASAAHDARAVAGRSLPVTVAVTDHDGARHVAVVEAGSGGPVVSWTSNRFDGNDLTDRTARVVHAMATAPDTAIGDLPVLSSAERDAHATLDRGPSAGPGIDLLTILRAHADERPHQTAIVDGEVALSYADLWQRVTRFAGGLAGLGARPGDTVALLLPRSTGLVIAMLGAMSAGVTFAPINPRNPTDRVRQLVVDAGARLVVAKGSWDLPATVHTTAAIMRVGRRHVASPAPHDRPPGPSGPSGPIEWVAPHDRTPGPSGRAYVMFTSGTTGRPKGVVISSAALSRYLEAIVAAYGLVGTDRVLQLTDAGFDVMLEEVLPTLVVGATVVIAGPTCLESPDAFEDVVRRCGVTVLNLSTSVWMTVFARTGTDELSGPPEGVRLVVVGSERVPATAVLSWHRAATGSTRLVNAYGTTETTITSVVCELDRAALATVAEAGVVPIGRPLTGTTAAVLDPEGDPCPFGVAGELVLGGVGLMSGYLGDPPPQRHATGDQVRLEPSGVLTHLGRLDGQLKIRGRRIEPAEVEAALERLSSVRRAACTAVGHGARARLVAAVAPVTPEATDPDRIRTELALLVPYWLVPEHIVVVPVIPMNERGKVDLRWLRTLEEPRRGRPRPHPASPTARRSTRPMTATEIGVAQCVAEVLGCPMPDAGANFFALGGNSLQAVRLVARIAENLGATVQARQIFSSPTIAGIARTVDEAGWSTSPALVRRTVRGPYPLTGSQQAMLRYLGRADRPRPYFEMCEAHRIAGPLDVVALERALRAVVARHEGLRSIVDPATATHIPLPAWTPLLRTVDLSGLPAPAAALDQELRAAKAPFDLTSDPAFRATLIRLGPTEHVLALTFHHLFFDGWSYGVFYAQVSELYQAGPGPVLPNVDPDFGDYTSWLDQVVDSSADQSFWRDRLAGYQPPEVCRLLTAPEADSLVASALVPMTVSQRVETLAASLSTTAFAALSAAFAVVLGHVVDSQDLLLASNDANRNEAGTERMIGYLSATLLNRIRLDPQESFVDLIRRVHAGAAAGRQHMATHWEDLVTRLGLADAVQFRFSLQDSPLAGTLRIPGLVVEPLPEEATRGGRRAVVVDLRRGPEGYRISWYARADLPVAIPPATAARLFVGVLAEVVDNPAATVGELVTSPRRTLR